MCSSRISNAAHGACRPDLITSPRNFATTEEVIDVVQAARLSHRLHHHDHGAGRHAQHGNN
jgi:hypothetical protein